MKSTAKLNTKLMFLQEGKTQKSIPVYSLLDIYIKQIPVNILEQRHCVYITLYFQFWMLIGQHDFSKTCDIVIQFNTSTICSPAFEFITKTAHITSLLGQDNILLRYNYLKTSCAKNRNIEKVVHQSIPLLRRKRFVLMLSIA